MPPLLYQRKKNHTLFSSQKPNPAEVQRTVCLCLSRPPRVRMQAVGVFLLELCPPWRVCAPDPPHLLLGSTAMCQPALVPVAVQSEVGMKAASVLRALTGPALLSWKPQATLHLRDWSPAFFHLQVRKYSRT